MIAVEKGIPVLPAPTGGRPGKYPWKTMEVGDSFLVPYRQMLGRMLDRKHQTASLSRQASRKGGDLGMTFTARQTDEGVRVWRVK